MLGDQRPLSLLEDEEGVVSSPTAQLLTGLNEPQQEAVLHRDGPILVLAGAGSGKTRVLTHRVAQLIHEHHVYPDRILAVTFTNKASGEMKTRLKGLLGEKADRVWISTFHSTGLRILRHHASRLGYTNQFIIYDEQDSKGVLKQVIKELDIDDEKYPVDSFSRAIDRAKNNFVLPAELATRAFNVETDLQAQVYDKYQKLLLQANAMDFGDLLVNAVRVLREFPEVLEYYRRNLHYILVDEFQDTNKVQYMFIRLICEPRRNLFVVGDDDQSIYGFRGATISNILEFEKDFANTKVVKLEQNYRSSATILDAAHAVIEKNKARKAKKLWTSGAAGEQIRTFIGYDENEEANFISAEIKRLVTQGFKYSDIALLYRTNAQTRALEESLVRDRVPYRIFGGLKFFDRKEIKDILGYLRILVNPSDNQAFQRIVNTPPRGIGAQALQSIAEESRNTAIPFLHASVTVAESNKSVHKFLELMAEFKQATETMKLGQLIEFIVERSEYGPKLAAMKDPAAQSRIENLQELVALGRTMEGAGSDTSASIKEFLDRISLTSSADFAVNETAPRGEDEQPNTVSLMTLHLAKGLEFPVVFLCGLEEGLLPHFRSLDDANGLEEERRLCYVGITRAMKVLYMTRAYYRGMFGSGGQSGGAGGARVVSRFAKDIDRNRMLPVATERSQGANFLEGYPRFSFEDDEVDGGEGEYEREWRKRPKSSRVIERPQVQASLSLDRIKSLLAPADAIKTQNGPEVSKEYFDKPAAALEHLAEGVCVMHPSFGRGVVETVNGQGTSASVVVKFESFEEPKKLVYRFAKLVLVGSDE
jgi:DNA helicase-2/ATP-dependent DNA helicase PcrA